jgi:hypothetical protein
MAAYSHYLGALVSVQYRFGDVVLSASGEFVGDSGRSIFLEQHLEQRGKRKYFRWEIPYPNIHFIETKAEAEAGTPANRERVPGGMRVRAAAAGAQTSSSASSISRLSRPPKTA